MNKKIAALIVTFAILSSGAFAFESTYTIVFDHSSTYFLFLRAKNITSHSISLTISVDNQVKGMVELQPSESFEWYKFVNGIFFQKGSHQILFKTNDVGFLFEKFELSEQVDYSPAAEGMPTSRPKSLPVKFREIPIEGMGGEVLIMSDLNNNGTIDFLTTSERGVAAFENDGHMLWEHKFRMPDYVGWHFVLRPSDINNDGYMDVIGPFFENDSLFLACYNGISGDILTKYYLPPLPKDWDYEGIQIANLDGSDYSHYVIVKSNITTGYYGSFKVQALNFKNNRFNPYWIFERFNSDRGIYHQPLAYDLNGDRKDELLCGYWTLRPDGKILWEKPDGFFDEEHHMDSMRAGDVIPSNPGPEIVSASGLMVMDANGNVIWRKDAYGNDLGEGQSVAIDNFRDDLPGLEVLFAFQAPDNDEILYSSNGDLLWKYDGPSLYDASFETTPIRWIGDSQKEVLEQDWGRGRVISIYDEYLKLIGDIDPSEEYGQVHYRVADVTGDYREEIICYNKDFIVIYTNEAPNNHFEPSPWENNEYKKWQINWIYY